MKVVIQERLNHRQWIALYDDNGRYIASVWGTAKVRFSLNQGLTSRYLLSINHATAFFHVDAIELHKLGEG